MKLDRPCFVLPLKSRCGRGYIPVSRGGVRKYAHQWAWIDNYGPIPEGLLVCHHCDNPPCSEPTHLFIGTGFDNMRDAARKGRLKHNGRFQGAKHPRAKLDDNKVLEIRRLASLGWSYLALAKRYGVRRQTINRIIIGKTWTHV